MTAPACFPNQINVFVLFRFNRILGLNIIFQASWNILDDPALAPIIALMFILCRFVMALSKWIAEYLKVRLQASQPLLLHFVLW